MSLYPVTKQMVWQMIENERRLGEPFTLQGAIASYLYDLISSEPLSQRNYVKVWSWTHKKVRLHWEQITTTAELIYSNSEGHTRGTLRAQKDAIPEQKEGIGAHEGHTRGTHLQSTNNISIPKTSDIPPPPADLRDAYAGEQPAPDSVDLSFLWDNDLNHESGVRKALREFSHPSPPELIRTLWGRRGRADFSSLTELVTRHGWPVFVAAAVITTNEASSPGINFLTKVCNRLTAQRHEQHSQNIRPEAATGIDEGPGGVPIYNLIPHDGAALPGGVRAGRHGGRQNAGRNQGAYKRPGERSWEEHLRACGYSEDEIAASGSPFGGERGSAGASGGPGDGEILPHRPVLRLRA